MTIPDLLDDFIQNIEELPVSQSLVDARLEFVSHGIPVDTLVLKVGVLPVNGIPKELEIHCSVSRRRIITTAIQKATGQQAKAEN